MRLLKEAGTAQNKKQDRREPVTHKDLARKLGALERKYDTQFEVVFDAIRQLVMPSAPKRRRIGFGASE